MKDHVCERGKQKWEEREQFQAELCGRNIMRWVWEETENSHRKWLENEGTIGNEDVQ